MSEYTLTLMALRTSYENEISWFFHDNDENSFEELYITLQRPGGGPQLLMFDAAADKAWSISWSWPSEGLAWVEDPKTGNIYLHDGYYSPMSPDYFYYSWNGASWDTVGSLRIEAGNTLECQWEGQSLDRDAFFEITGALDTPNSTTDHLFVKLEVQSSMAGAYLQDYWRDRSQTFQSWNSEDASVQVFSISDYTAVFDQLLPIYEEQETDAPDTRSLPLIVMICREEGNEATITLCPVYEFGDSIEASENSLVIDGRTYLFDGEQLRFQAAAQPLITFFRQPALTVATDFEAEYEERVLGEWIVDEGLSFQTLGQQGTMIQPQDITYGAECWLSPENYYLGYGLWANMTYPEIVKAIGSHDVLFDLGHDCYMEGNVGEYILNMKLNGIDFRYQWDDDPRYQSSISVYVSNYFDEPFRYRYDNVTDSMLADVKNKYLTFIQNNITQTNPSTLNADTIPYNEQWAAGTVLSILVADLDSDGMPELLLGGIDAGTIFGLSGNDVVYLGNVACTVGDDCIRYYHDTQTNHIIAVVEGLSGTGADMTYVLDYTLPCAAFFVNGPSWTESAIGPDNIEYNYHVEGGTKEAYQKAYEAFYEDLELLTTVYYTDIVDTPKNAFEQAFSNYLQGR